MSNFYGVFQLIGGIIMSVGYIPQIAQILRTKSSEGLNLKSFGMIFVPCMIPRMEPAVAQEQSVSSPHLQAIRTVSLKSPAP